jgi:hypothetical protein
VPIVIGDEEIRTNDVRYQVMVSSFQWHPVAAELTMLLES